MVKVASIFSQLPHLKNPTPARRNAVLPILVHTDSQKDIGDRPDRGPGGRLGSKLSYIVGNGVGSNKRRGLPTSLKSGLTP